jgi:hypothetical protein
MFASLPFPFTDRSPLLTGTHWFIISPGHDQWVVTFEWNPYRLDGSIANHLDPPVMCALEPWTQISSDHGCRCHESMGKGFCMLTKLIMYQRISKPNFDVTTSTRLWFCTFWSHLHNFLWIVRVWQKASVSLWPNVAKVNKPNFYVAKIRPNDCTKPRSCHSSVGQTLALNYRNQAKQS